MSVSVGVIVIVIASVRANMIVVVVVFERDYCITLVKLFLVLYE